MRSVALMMVASFGILAYPSAGLAQPLSGCGTRMSDCGDDGFHWVVEHPSGTVTDSHPCMASHWWSHWPCGPEEEDVDAQAALADAMEAASNGDVRMLVEVRPLLTDYVTYNRERGALQVMSCDKKSIIANLPLTADLVRAVEEQDLQDR